MAQKPERVDPPRRTAGTLQNAFDLQNKDPNKHYVIASLTQLIQGLPAVEYYENLGYDVEKHRPDGVRTGLRQTNREKNQGQPFQLYGGVVMSCPLERKAELDLYGPTGDGGQQAASELEDKYLKKGGRDLLRGMNPNSPYVSLRVGREHTAPVPLNAGSEE